MTWTPMMKFTSATPTIAVRCTFLEHYDFTGKTIHPFCTHEGSGLSDTENDIRKAAHGAAVTKGLAIHGSHVDEAKSALAQWAEEVAK